ncbi:MAG: STM3941 family protein [Candidatus Saccharimonadales bacterium]
MKYKSDTKSLAGGGVLNQSYPATVFYQGRLKALGIFALCLLFTIIGTTLLEDDPTVAWLAIGFFGVLVLPITIYQVIKPGYLKLDASGFEISTFAKKLAHTKWTDVDNFGVIRIAGNAMVSLQYSDHYQKYIGGRLLAKGIAGVEGALMLYGGMKAQQQADLLNDYRKHYSEQGEKNEI